MSAPAFTVRIEFEALAPMVFVDASNESEYRRLLDWLDAHPQLHVLLAYVQELQEEARAA